MNSAMENRSYRAVCFDLDGTLLPMELEDFLGSYFKALAPCIIRHGVSAEDYQAGLNGGIKAMMKHDDDRTNDALFWETFYAHVDPDMADWTSVFLDFYENDFGHIGDDMPANPAAARAVNALRAKGYPLALTTMPVFPLRAVTWRVEWAGVDPAAFARITTFDNSTSVKPKLAYFAENLAALGLRGEDVLMVGNNTREDLSFMQLGADAYLVTDCLIDPVEFDLESVRHGSLEQFADWVEALPDCENPATDIRPGLIPVEERDAVLASYLDEEARAEDAAAGAAHLGAYDNVADAGVED